MFCLFYEARTGKVHALNGSGRAPRGISLEKLRRELGEGAKGIPMESVHAVTVPGAAAGWVDVVERFGTGKVGLGEVLSPAIELAEEGFPVSELTGYYVGCFFHVSCFAISWHIIVYRSAWLLTLPWRWISFSRWS